MSYPIASNRNGKYDVGMYVARIEESIKVYCEFLALGQPRKLFFMSRSPSMIVDSVVLVVALLYTNRYQCSAPTRHIEGTYRTASLLSLMNTFHPFSSPIVPNPWVILLESTSS